MISVEPPPALAGLRWHRVDAVLVNTRVARPAAAHPFAVVQAVMKGATAEAARGGRELSAGSSVFFHLRGRHHGSRLAEGARMPVAFVLCGVDDATARGWADALTRHLGPGGRGRNFRLDGDPVCRARGWADAVADNPPPAPEGEACLEFLSPVPLDRQPGKPRGFLDAAGLVVLLERRLRLLFGVEGAYDPGDDAFEVLHPYWEYIEIRHSSRSQPGHTQLVKGCVGKLYIKGRYANLLPLLVLGAELHAGPKRSNSQGYYRLHPQPVPWFAPRFPSRASLAAACRDVLERYDDAAARLADGPVDRFDEDAYAGELASALVDGSYAPAPHTAFRITKKDGGERLIEQLEYRDLIVAQYLLRILGPVLDRLFEESSVGFRKGRSRAKAAEAIRRHIASGCRYVLESDIEDFFPSVDLRRLESLLDRVLPRADEAVRRTLHVLLWNGRVLHGSLQRRGRGLAQGNPLSPLLANLYLDAFDETLRAEGVHLVRYADDFVVLTRTREEAERVLCVTEACLAEWGLGINRAKTAIRPVSEGFGFLGYRFDADEEPRDASSTPPPRVKKPLYVTEPHVFLALSGAALEVRRDRRLVQSIPLRRISEVMVLGRASFSANLVGRLAQMKIPLTFASPSGYHMATVQPDSKAYWEVSHRHAARFEALSDAEHLALAKAFAAAKLANYRAFFQRRQGMGTAGFLAELDAAVDAIGQAPDADAVRGHEGAAARKIFARLATLIRAPGFRLRRRQRSRPDRMNALLNFGYYLLFTQINAAVRSVGLNPYLGFLHSHRNDYESLVCDIEELFRVRVDRLLLRIVNRGWLTDADFTRSDRGAHLRHEAAKKFAGWFEDEMAARDARDRVALKDVIHAQVETVKAWAVDGAALELYEWRP